jgi:hypothetical protein
MAERRDDRSLGELFGDLSRQLSTLVRQEIDLARTEITMAATGAARDTGLIGAGGALLYAALLGVLAAIVLLLVDLGLTPWVAALVVAIVVGIVGAALVARGRQGLSSQELMPKRTVQSIKEDAEWVKEQMP